jgi:hypothetical protein
VDASGHEGDVDVSVEGGKPYHKVGRLYHHSDEDEEKREELDLTIAMASGRRAVGRRMIPVAKVEAGSSTL